MKILHLVAGEVGGGAARGAYWLHKAQCEIGIESTLMISGSDAAGDSTVIPLGNTSIRRVKHALLSRLGNSPVYFYRKRRPWYYSTGFAGINITRLAEYRRADLIHLHWINGLVSTRAMSDIDKPIVWTLRDMWPFTGGCHAVECERYRLGCGKCPQLNSACAMDLSRLVVLSKRYWVPRDIRIVGVSRWLSDCARFSEIFKNYSIQTISNNIDTREFYPVEKNVARKLLGLPIDKKIILFGAQQVDEYHKGLGLLLDSIHHVNRSDACVVGFGRHSGDGVRESGGETISLGYLSDIIALRLAYSAADVFVAPSVIEAFGKTIAEAQSCGVPVVCFDATGPKDIVEHLVTGFKARPYDAENMAKGINWVLDRPESYRILMGKRARERMIRYFDSRVIAIQYQGLYNEILGVGSN